MFDIVLEEKGIMFVWIILFYFFMTVESENYKLEILEYAVNQSIDLLLPNNSENALSIILYQSNEVAWKVATEIYTKGGHQIDFLFIRDLLDLRIKPLRNKIAEEVKIRAELEAQRLAREIEEERVRNEKKAEKAKIKAKLEVQRQTRKAEEERIRKEKEAEEEKIRNQKEETRQKKLEEFSKLYPNVSIDIFVKIEAIIVEQLLVEEEEVTMDADLTSNLGANELDIEELITALEEEFDIEIPDNFTWVYLSFAGSCVPLKLKPISVKQIVDLVSEKIQ